MRIVSAPDDLDLALFRSLLKTATDGINTANVEMTVGWRDQFWYAGVEPIRRSRSLYDTRVRWRYPVRVDLMRPPIAPRMTPSVRTGRRYPDFKVETWEDAVVYWVAMTLKHHADWRKRREDRKTKVTWYRAEQFAIKRLNAWRQATGRTPFVPVKQADPFTHHRARRAQAAEFNARVRGTRDVLV